MARFTSSLVFLSLCLCETQSQRTKMNIKLSSSDPLAVGAKLELECVISDRSLSDSGVSWVRQHRDSAPQFIMFISSLGRVALTDNGEVSAGFGGKRESSNYRLSMLSFKKQDQGNYYCIVNHNQKLHFSSGLQLYFPPPTLPSPLPHTPGPFFLCAQKTQWMSRVPADSLLPLSVSFSLNVSALWTPGPCFALLFHHSPSPSLTASKCQRLAVHEEGVGLPTALPGAPLLSGDWKRWDK
uniref:T-cell surface glycoprotein CD8 alpha chain n=1 Tax=Pelusios castaneus TaxID=367368 RepID=A0A8C8RDQ5_9SAUR